jgi:hypothetical protein
MDLLDIDFGPVSRYKGVGIDQLFIHIIFLKIALIYIIIIVGIPTTPATPAIAIDLAVARAIIGCQT